MKPEQVPHSRSNALNIGKLIAERFPKAAILREESSRRNHYEHRTVSPVDELSYFKEFIINYDLTQPEADKYLYYLITWASKRGKLNERQQYEMLKFVATETTRQRRGH